MRRPPRNILPARRPSSTPDAGVGGTALQFARVSREAATFDYLYAKAAAPGWAFHVVVTDSPCLFMAIQKALTAAGFPPARSSAL